MGSTLYLTLIKNQVEVHGVSLSVVSRFIIKLKGTTTIENKKTNKPKNVKVFSKLW